MKDYSDDEARLAKNEETVFSNRTKVILFLIAVGVGVSTIWEKCSSLAHSSVVAADSTRRRPTDSLAVSPGVAQHGPNQATIHRHRSKTAVKPITDSASVSSSNKNASSNSATPPNRDGQTGGRASQLMEKPISRIVLPLQTINAEEIEMKLVSAEGNRYTQTIKMTLVLTNHAANRFIWSAVESISDADGNEYVVKSFTNGASPYDNHIPLDTEAPRKCTYTFGGILPSVKMIRLFKFRYRHKSLDDPNTVEFRNIPISWN
jgi:hypothetical protein